MRQEQVILVDSNDEEIGLMPKLEAHQKGLLHRAFSVFIFNTKGEMLLQQRSLQKYHSPGLWSNACCSHPRKGEEVIEAAKRRLQEEMGMECELKPAFNFIYRASFENGLVEHEFDHVFIGTTDSEPILNPDEVADWKHMAMPQLVLDIKINTQLYTEWLKILFEKVSAFVS